MGIFKIKFGILGSETSIYNFSFLYHFLLNEMGHRAANGVKHSVSIIFQKGVFKRWVLRGEINKFE